VLAKTEDVPTETPIEEDFYVAGLEFVEAHGADIATSSLGYIDWYTQNDMNGVTAVTTIAVNIATANGLICFTAAGNEGHDSNPATNTLIAPADALQVISCGAVDNTGAIASFSTDGPTVDGRVKPELLAMGVSTATVNSTNTSGISGVSGTSLSTPLLAGAAACILQARPDFTVNSLRAALFATASRSDSNGLHPDPLFITGYGIARAFAATQVPPPCPGDLNNSGSVDSSDIGTMLGEFGICAQCAGDLNYDGTVDASDLGTLLGHFGSCP
jgi:subtilisin family serine protease